MIPALARPMPNTVNSLVTTFRRTMNDKIEKDRVSTSDKNRSQILQKWLKG